MNDLSKNIFKSILVILVLLMTSCSKKDDKLVWTSINVCHFVQGDAHLISKNGKHFLVDAAQWKEAEQYLLPYLKKHNIKELEAILITHPHFDHYGGVTTLIENNITVNKIYMNMPTEKQMRKEWWGGEYKHLLYIKKIAKKYNVKISSLKSGDRLTFDKKSYIDVLYAYNGIDTPVGKTDINDMSAITMIHDGENRFLLTGDLNQKLGTYLAKEANNIKADIMKFPHHGASPFAPNTFFKKVDPKVVIVPAPTYLWCSDRDKMARELSKKNNYKTFINGFHGDITVTSYNNQYNITTEKKPKNICKEEK